MAVRVPDIVQKNNRSTFWATFMELNGLNETKQNYELLAFSQGFEML